MKKSLLLLLFFCLFKSGCSPVKSNGKDQQQYLGVVFHELQTHLDNAQHDLKCFQAELQILEERVKQNENSLALFKQQYDEGQNINIERLRSRCSTMEDKLRESEEKLHQVLADLRNLQNHANSSTMALSQYKNRLNEFEQQLLTQNRRFEEIGKLKHTIEALALSFRSPSHELIYKVKSGDTLEKIAKVHKTTVEAIKKANRLEKDVIYSGQELVLPIE